MAIAGKKALIKVTGSSIAMTDEATSTTDDQTYQIDDTTKRVWCRTCTITVEEDGSPTGENYTINRLTGTITFATVDVGRGTITVTGEYLPLSNAAESYEYSYALEATNLDSTTFGNEFMARTQGLIDITGSISEFREVTSIFLDDLLSGNPIVLEIYSDSSNVPDLKVWALLMTDETSATVDALVEESLDWEGTHDSDSRVVSVNNT